VLSWQFFCAQDTKLFRAPVVISAGVYLVLRGSGTIEPLNDLFPVIFIDLYNVSYEILTQRFHLPDIY